MHSSGQVRNVFGTLRTVTEHLQGIVKLVLRTEVNLGTGFLSYLIAIVTMMWSAKAVKATFCQTTLSGALIHLKIYANASLVLSTTEAPS